MADLNLDKIEALTWNDDKVVERPVLEKGWYKATIKPDFNMLLPKDLETKQSIKIGLEIKINNFIYFTNLFLRFKGWKDKEGAIKEIGALKKIAEVLNFEIKRIEGVGIDSQHLLEAVSFEQKEIVVYIIRNNKDYNNQPQYWIPRGAYRTAEDKEVLKLIVNKETEATKVIDIEIEKVLDDTLPKSQSKPDVKKDLSNNEPWDNI